MPKSHKVKNMWQRLNNITKNQAKLPMIIIGDLAYQNLLMADYKSFTKV